jgi:hypothetical protein
MIEAEVRAIPVPQPSKEIGFYSFSKTHNGTVRRVFRTELEFVPLREYYLVAFRENGWNLVSSSDQKMEFCKDHGVARLTYRSETDGLRSFDILAGWGSPNRC